MAQDRKLEGRLKVLEEAANQMMDGAKSSALSDERPELALVEALGALTLEVRGLRLAVLSREPVRWWW